MGSTGRDVEARLTARAQAAETGTTLAADGSLRAADALEEVKITTRKTTSLNFNTDPNIGRKSKSELGILKFPENVGQGVPYMLLKIFETQTGTVPIGDQTTGSLREGANVFAAGVAGVPALDAVVAGAAGGQVAGIAGSVFGVAATTELGSSAIDAAGNKILGVSDITSRAKDLVKNFALKRNIEQLALGIALFMPDGINTNYDNEYEALSVTATLGGFGFAAQALSAKRGFVKDINPYIAEAASKVAGKLVGNEDFAKLGLFATTGLVNNPQLETIYTSPVLRRFTFDFRMIPRNATESEMIKIIIDRLKYFAAPTILDGTGGRFLIPPAQFEIEFYDGNDNQNLYLFKTKKCVLSGISVDYSPNGFATFANGAPVETRMQLTFQETVIIDKNAVNEGY
jgi:hypothetical protein